MGVPHDCIAYLGVRQCFVLRLRLLRLPLSLIRCQFVTNSLRNRLAGVNVPLDDRRPVIAPFLFFGLCACLFPDLDYRYFSLVVGWGLGRRYLRVCGFLYWRSWVFLYLRFVIDFSFAFLFQFGNIRSKLVQFVYLIIDEFRAVLLGLHVVLGHAEVSSLGSADLSFVSCFPQTGQTFCLTCGQPCCAKHEPRQTANGSGFHPVHEVFFGQNLGVRVVYAFIDTAEILLKRFLNPFFSGFLDDIPDEPCRHPWSGFLQDFLRSRSAQEHPQSRRHYTKRGFRQP